MSDLPNGRANQRAGLRKAESLRKVDQIAMAAIRSCAEGMASTGISRLDRGRPVGSTRFQKVALHEKTFDSWRELRNELGFQTDDRLPCAGHVCVWTKHRRKVANQAMLLGSDSFPSRNKQPRSNCRWRCVILNVRNSKLSYHVPRCSYIGLLFLPTRASLS